MANYSVRFTFMGSGVIEVQAKSKQAAEDLVFDMSTAQLLEWTDFDGGLNIDDIEKIE